MATKTVSIVTGGNNQAATNNTELMAVATDFITNGVVGAISNTSGVAPTTGAFAVNAQGTPNMTVRVSAGTLYQQATPSGGSTQAVRVVMTTFEDVTIAANVSGSNRFDFIYLAIDQSLLANPGVNKDNVASLVVSRSTLSNTDNGTPPAAGYLLAVVTVANNAASIVNSNITDSRLQAGINFAGPSSIPATALQAGAITLGYAQIIASFSTTSATAVQVTGLTVPITVPAGGRKLRITAWCSRLNNASTNATTTMNIWDGTPGSGTQLATADNSSGTVGADGHQAIAVAIVSPAAGAAKTYNVGLTSSSAANGTITASATSPAFILVEAI